MFSAPDVNVSAALTRGFERMKKLLFPFDLERWITLGFCAWLCFLGEGSSSTGNFDIKDWFSGEEEEEVSWNILDWLHTLFWGEGNFLERIARLLEMETGMVLAVLSGILVLVVIIVAISIVIAYFQARIQFVWLDNLVMRRALIRQPYGQYKTQGGELFKGKLLITVCYYLLVAAVIFLLLTPFIAYLRESARVGEWGCCSVGMICSGVGLVLFLLFNMLFLFYFGLLFSFAPIIIYQRGITFREAWKTFNQLLRERWKPFVKFLLWNWLIGIGFSMLLMMVICCSCCLMAIPLALPVIGATMILPWYVFRGYFIIEFYEMLTGETLNEEECEEVLVAEIITPGREV